METRIYQGEKQHSITKHGCAITGSSPVFGAMKQKLILAMMLVGMISSCTDAGKAKLGGFDNDFKIELVNCDGSITHSWISSGKVLSEEGSDGYYFMDKETGILIEVTGSLIITKQ